MKMSNFCKKIKFSSNQPKNLEIYSHLVGGLVLCHNCTTYVALVEKIGNSDITIHEKRKPLQKTHVGETVINLITNVILPYLKQLK